MSAFEYLWNEAGPCGALPKTKPFCAPCRKQYSRNQAPHLESWKTQDYYASRPRGVNSRPKLWALNRVFLHGQAWLSRFVGFQGLDDYKEQDRGEWSKLQSLVLWVPTFWDLRDPDFARSKLSYRGKMSRKLCKILTFPLHSPFLMLLLCIVESIISCFGRTFRAPHRLGGYIELLAFVTLWI